MAYSLQNLHAKILKFPEILVLILNDAKTKCLWCAQLLLSSFLHNVLTWSNSWSRLEGEIVAKKGFFPLFLLQPKHFLKSALAFRRGNKVLPKGLLFSLLGFFYNKIYSLPWNRFIVYVADETFLGRMKNSKKPSWHTYSEG